MLQSRASAALGTTSLYKRETMSGVVPRHRPGRAGDLMLRNFEVYDIVDNQLTDAVSLGQVGWAVRRLSSNGLQRLHRQLGRSAQLSARESCTRWPASATIRPMPRLSSARGADNVTTDVPDTPHTLGAMTTPGPLARTTSKASSPPKSGAFLLNRSSCNGCHSARSSDPAQWLARMRCRVVR
jgi:hypothetical protein